MPCLIYLQERLTHSYNDGWQHLDKWGEGGTFHVLKTSKRVYDENDSRGEYWSTYITIKQPRNMPHDLVERILESAFRYSCKCEHDCCGHISTWVRSAKHIKRREWRVEIGHAINC